MSKLSNAPYGANATCPDCARTGAGCPQHPATERPSGYTVLISIQDEKRIPVFEMVFDCAKEDLIEPGEATPGDEPVRIAINKAIFAARDGNQP